MTRIGRWAFGVGRWMFSASLQLAMALHLISQPLLVAMRPHPFAAFVLGNFCLPSFFKRAHSDFRVHKSRFNHLTRGIATAFPRRIAAGRRLIRSIRNANTDFEWQNQAS